jgi:hypothetical protein
MIADADPGDISKRLGSAEGYGGFPRCMCFAKFQDVRVV